MPIDKEIDSRQKVMKEKEAVDRQYIVVHEALLELRKNTLKIHFLMCVDLKHLTDDIIFF